MSTTASTYINRIDIGFPVKGKDNDSQGFRDNFNYIRQAIDAVNSQTEYLSKVAVTTAGTSTFYGNTIDSANFKNCSTELYSYDLIDTYNIGIDYSLGSYQTFSLAPGDHSLTISNWPATGKSGSIRLSITSGNPNVYTAVTFADSNVTSLDTTTPTYELSSGANIFDIWSEDSLGGSGANYYVKNVASGSGGSNTGLLTSEKLQISTNFYTTGTNGETYVRHNNTYATLATLPTVQTFTILDSITQTDSAVSFNVSASVQNIAAGATFYISGNTNQYTVTGIITATNTIVTSHDAWPISQNDSVTFVNPNLVNQPTVTTLVNDVPATGVMAAKNELAGTVYTNNTATYITFANYADGTINKLLISGDSTPSPRSLGAGSTATTQGYSDSSTLLATTEFVANAITSSTVVVAQATTATYAVTATNAAVVTGATSNGFGTRTVSIFAPTTGGNAGDIWYQIL